MTSELFGGRYAGRRVMVTGHTGFLGTWAVRWLTTLGAQVAGYSRGMRDDMPPGSQIWAFEGDIADAKRVAYAMATFQPEIVLHLAATATVAAAFRNPGAAFTSNVAGTVAVLDAAMRQREVRSVVVVGTPATTALGDDLQLAPYPASKLAVEACVAAYAHDRTQQAAARSEPLRIGLARPGVMIGGDWGEGRLVADVVRALWDGQPVKVGAPLAVRPWQHVLDGVSGALTLAAQLWEGPAPRRRYDFGCGPEGSGTSVRDVVNGFLNAYGFPGWPVAMGDGGAADRVELGYTAARADLGWIPVWDIGHTLAAAADWYHAAVRSPVAIASAMDGQIASYATRAGSLWAAAPV